MALMTQITMKTKRVIADTVAIVMAVEARVVDLVQRGRKWAK